MGSSSEHSSSSAQPGATAQPNTHIQQSFLASFISFTAIATFVIILTLCIAIRIHLISMVFERDEGEYAYVGSRILAGEPPFLSAYTMKLPGTAAMYAIFEAVGGQTIEAIRTGMLFVNLLTAGLVYLLSSRMLTARFSRLAAAFYLITSLSISVLGPMAHATHFVVFFYLVGFCILSANNNNLSYKKLIMAGLFFGLSFMMKQSAIPIVIFAALYAGWVGRRSGGRQQGLRSFFAFSVAAAAPYLIFVVFIISHGVFSKFWFWTIAYARAYASLNSFSQGVRHFTTTTIAISNGIEPILILSLIGAAAALKSPREARERTLWVGGFIASILATSLDLMFRPHYYVLILPFVSVFCAYTLERLAMSRSHHARKALLSALLIVGICGYSYQHLCASELNLPPDLLTEMTYNPLAMFTKAPNIADYIEKHTPKGSSIAVIGSEPEIYYYSHREAACPYLYLYPIMERQSYQNRMIKDYENNIEKNKPIMIVVQESDLRNDKEDHVLPESFKAWLRLYIQQHYRYAYSDAARSISHADCPLFPHDPTATYYWVFSRINKGK